MKELYVSPELELICLTATERLANEFEIEFNGLRAGEDEAVTPSTHDIDVPLTNLP